MYNAIFQISINPIEENCYITESDLYDTWFEREIALYVSDEVNRETEIKILKDSTQNKGISFGEDEHGSWFVIESKEKFFEDNFVKFKEELTNLAKLTLEDFSTKTLGTYFLNKHFDDKYGVYFHVDGEIMTLDNFVRICLTGEKHYIGGVVGYKS